MNIKKIKSLNEIAVTLTNLKLRRTESRGVCAELATYSNQKRWDQAHLSEVAQSGQAEELGSSGDQVSMSQRQQQHRAVQQAVRQVDGPRSSRLWSSTTYTVVLGGS